MHIKLMFFATLKERAGLSQAELTLDGPLSVAELRRVLLERYPNLRGALEPAVASVNREFAFEADAVPDGAEVAFFPPVSGGSDSSPARGPDRGLARVTVAEITAEPIDLDALLAKIVTPAAGAACVFSGFVRGRTERDNPHDTIYLEYEAYEPMARAKMQQVADEIRARWPTVLGIALVQRIGRLLPTTPTVLIACSAAHRDTGVFEAARFGIDRLKEIVPVWKKEVGPGGETWVEGSYTPTPEDLPDGQQGK